jgi:uncharacterized protein (TIGR02271 family)
MPAEHEGDRMVTDSTGRRGRVIAHTQAVEGNELIEITLADQKRALVPGRLLEADGQSGNYRLANPFEQFVATGVDDEQEDSETIRIPVIEEDLAIGKREVETGHVHVSVSVNEREELVDVPLTAERVEVERIPVNRIVDAPLEPRYEDDTLVVPVVEERLVVQKQLVLTEEVRIRRVSETRDHQERITLRSQDVEIDRD